ncbi:MAG: multi-sensor hybrid histidine kinase [Verrucomicrobiales bacterium]|nr:multi-sensor hybrid histidine kinase [Verrucomicrobiales bacterium]
MTTPGLILVVDDEIDVLSIFEACLTRFGFTVLCAKSEAEAHNHWQALHSAIGLVIIDVNLTSEGTGLQLLDRLRTTEPAIPYLVTSGYLPEMIEWHTPLVDGCNFLQKPIAWQNLRTFVGQILSSRLATQG